jgi:F-type H+-transporting ATPase subunit b
MKLNSPVFRAALVLVAAVVLIFSFYGFSAAASGGHGEENPAQSASKLWELLARLINFVILAVVLIFLIRKPIKSFFGNRSEKIRKDFEELELRKQQAQAQLEEIGKKLAQMEHEREKIIAKFIKEGESEKEKIIQSAKALQARIEGQAELVIKQEVQEARQALKHEVAELATKMAEELIKKKIKPDDEERLVKQYTEKMVEAA